MDHQAKARLKGRRKEEELSIEELEGRLERVKEGWEGLGERILELAKGRAEVMARYAKVKDPVMDLISEREAKVSSHLVSSRRFRFVVGFADFRFTSLVSFTTAASTSRTPILRSRLHSYSSNGSHPGMGHRNPPLLQHLRRSNRFRVWI